MAFATGSRPIVGASRSSQGLDQKDNSMRNVRRTCGRYLLLGLTLVGVPTAARAQGPDAAPRPSATAGRSTKQAPEQQAVLNLLQIPAAALPAGVRLAAGTPATASPISVTSNPGIVAEPQQRELIARFFGIRDKADLQPVQSVVVALYQDHEPANEIGIYALVYAEEQIARERFEKLSKGSTISPFIHRDRLLLYLWKDAGASDAALESIGKHLRSTRLKLDEPRRPEQNPDES